MRRREMEKKGYFSVRAKMSFHQDYGVTEGKYRVLEPSAYALSYTGLYMFEHISCIIKKKNHFSSINFVLNL